MSLVLCCKAFGLSRLRIYIVAFVLVLLDASACVQVFHHFCVFFLRKSAKCFKFLFKILIISGRLEKR